MKKWGWRKRRILELEEQLKDALENLAVAVVPLPQMGHRITVEKGKWYHIGFKFMHTGAPVLTLAELLVELDQQHQSAYFDGTDAR